MKTIAGFPAVPLAAGAIFVGCAALSIRANGRAAGEAVPGDALQAAEHASLVGRALDDAHPLVAATLEGPALDPAVTAAAARAFENALALAPFDAALHHTLAWIRWAEGDDRRAEEHFRQAVARAPSDGVYGIALGLFFESHDRRRDADEAFARSLAAGPSVADSAFFDELTATDGTRAGQLLEAAIAHLDGGGGPAGRAREGKLRFALGQTEVAETLLQSAVRAQPNLSRAWLNLGDVARATGRPDEALTRYRIAWRTGADRRLVAPRLAEIHAALDQEEEAERWSRAAGAGDGPDTRGADRERLYRGRRNLVDGRVPIAFHRYCAAGPASGPRGIWNAASRRRRRTP